MTQPQPGWLNKKDMAASCGVCESAFAKWNIEPVARIGRETFFRARDVIAARMRHQRAKAGACEECGYLPNAAITRNPNWNSACSKCGHPTDGTENPWQSNEET